LAKARASGADCIAPSAGGRNEPAADTLFGRDHLL